MVGQVVAVASGKGGVGKTTTVVNLGVVLRRANHSVALVDADLGMANLGPMLGITPEWTLHDVLAGEASVEEAIVEEAQGFGVLAGSDSLSDYSDADPAGLKPVLETLAAEYEFVLIDTGAGMSHEDVLPLGLADSVILVTTPDPAAIGDTRKTAELAELASGTTAGLVVTKAEADTDAKHAATQVGVKLLGVIPYDSTVTQSTAAGRPLEAVDPETPAAAAYRELAESIAAGSPEPVSEPPADEVAESVGASPSDPEAADSGAAEEERADTEEVDADAKEPAESEETEESEADSDGIDVDLGGHDLEIDLDEAVNPEVDDSADIETKDSNTPADERAESPDSTAPDEAKESVEEAPTGADEDGTEESAGGVDGEEVDEEEEDYLAEFEDDDSEDRGGFLSRLGRLFK